MPIHSFRELIVWQKAHALALGLYDITKDFPRSEIFGLSLQMRRAVVSVSSNVAEGFKRQSKKDARHFYNIAEGSLEELRAQCIFARDLGYITSERYGEIESLADEVARLLDGWKRSQK